MKKKMNKKGFTLIELLAVIVILGVVMGIAIPAMSGYIENSRKDTMISTAQQYIDSARNLLISENVLPPVQSAVVVPVNIIDLEKGGVSPYTNSAFNTTGGQSYVFVYNTATDVNNIKASDYIYAVALNDGSKGCLDLVSEKFLTSSSARIKRGHIKTTGCTIATIKEAPGAADSSTPEFTVVTATGEKAVSKVSFNGSNFTFYNE